jgi:DNA mismatch repair protein MSH5
MQSENIVRTNSMLSERVLIEHTVEGIDGQFQVRPWKEFTVTRGIARLETLPLLASALPHSDEEELENPEEPRNAYDFMQRRRPQVAHPTLTHWGAGVRLGNFTVNGNKSPLCVSYPDIIVIYSKKHTVLHHRSSVRLSRSR